MGIFNFFRNKKNNIELEIFEKAKKSLTFNNKLIYAGELLKLSYEKYPEKIALIYKDKNIKYKELYFSSISLSLKLKNLGVKPRDRVLLYFENSIEFYISYFAIWMVGAVVIPANTFLHGKELAYIINDSTPTVIIISDNLISNWEKTLELNLINNIPQILKQENINLIYNLNPELEKNFILEKLNPEELCVLLYTSGTTGKPKGVMLSSVNILTNMLQCYTRLITFGEKENDKFFCVLPLFHVFAQNTCLWFPIFVGASVIIVQKIDRKLILEGLEKKPTIFLGFPALYGLLCLLKTAPLDSIRIFISGADMLPDKIRSLFSMIYGRKICAGYGLTEASPVVALNTNNDSSLSTQVAGLPFVGIECEIRDQVLWLKGDNIMMGYYKDPENTQKTLVNNWLNTGDLGTIDKDNNLSIIGRNKDLIIHKGFNIYPQEIENVLMSHPAVFKAAVIGQDEPFSGQIPIAFVATKTIDKKLEDDLRTLCANNLAQYKIPKKFICLEDLPINNTGKIDKKQLMSFNK